MWTDADDAVIGGDLTAALAYVTPAGGAVVTAVAPIGMRDREAGTVAFTTSLGFGRKLDRIKENPKVALAYHAREHGFASEPRFVLVQGTASYDAHPDRAVLENVVGPASTRFMGPPRRGPFWDRWLRVYYARPGAGDRAGRARAVLARPGLRRRARGGRSARAGRRSGRADAAEGRCRAARRRGPRGAATAPPAPRAGGLPRRRRLPADRAGDDRRGQRARASPSRDRSPRADAGPGCSPIATRRS